MCCQPDANFATCTQGSVSTCIATSTSSNTCGTYPGNQSVSYNQPQPCNPTSYSQQCTTSIQSYCATGFSCPGSTGVNNCTTSLTVNVFDDYSHDGSENGLDDGMSGMTVSVSGHGSQMTSSGTTTFTGLTTGSYTITVTVPSGYQATSTNPLSYTITANNPNQTVNFGLTELYTISGTIFNDGDLNQCYNLPNQGCTWNGTHYPPDPNSKDSPFTTSGSHIVITGTTPGTANATADASGGTYGTSQILPSGSYIVSYDTGTTPLPSGYRFTTPPSFTVTLGYTADTQAGYTCSIGTSSDTTNTRCTNPNNGSIVGLNFGLSNETAWTQPICGDIRVDSGYSQPIPSGASCNNTSAPYAIMQNSAVCPASAGVLFSGVLDPSYGQGNGPSTSGLQVGDSLFPETYTPHTLGAIESGYNFVMDSTNNLVSPPTPLTALCPFSSASSPCILSEDTPGGVYTSTPADGPVYLTVQNTDSTTQLGQANYAFVVGGDLYLESGMTLQASSSAAFISGGDIHVAGSVGETDWTSLAPDLEGFFSADKNFDIDRVSTAGPACNTDGSPIDKKLNVKGSVIINAGGGGGSVVNSREGCTEDLSCPSSTFQVDPQQLLHAPSLLKIPLTVWQELNP